MATNSVAKIFKKFVSRLGGKILIEPKFGVVGQMSFSKNKPFYFKNTSLDINGFAAAEIARDKDYTKFFLSKASYKVPQGKAFFSNYWCKVNKTKNNITAAIKYARNLKFPLIVKPNSRSQGEGVYKISNAKRLRKILEALFGKNDIVLIEKYVPGKDYRIVVLDGKVEIAYERKPLSVTGDGKRSVEELFDKKINALKRYRKINVDFSDPRILEKLKEHYKLSPKKVLEVGREITLLDNANLSSGGEAIDITDSIHGDYKNLAVKIAATMNLRFAGVDLIVPQDITKAISGGNYPICLEVNSSPGLNHFQTINNVARQRVENLYQRILIKLKGR